MKSSTVRRSALSKESMGVIENLSNNYNLSSNSEDTQQNYDNSLEEYVRTNDSETSTDSKSKEIDMLWQGFKSTQFSSNSPLMYVLGGFVTGVVVTLITLALFGVFGNSTHSGVVLPQDNEQTVEETVEDAKEIVNEETSAQDENTQDEKITKTEEEKPVLKTKKYIIKDGDTVEKIIRKEYGSYSQEKAEAIMKANNLSNLDHISIDQVLLLPVEQ